MRQYTSRKMEGEPLAERRRAIDEGNRAGGLNIQLCLNESEAFSGAMARYGKLTNVQNYIALVGKKSDDLEEKCGYYGEQLVLRAQQLGLNTCWVAATYSKGKSKQAVTIAPGEKLLMVIALGYGETQGHAHTNKPLETLGNLASSTPPWFRRGLDAAQLAPTAMNQQKFFFRQEGDRVTATTRSGPYTRVDLGIAKYHFEIGAGDSGWHWSTV